MDDHGHPRPTRPRRRPAAAHVRRGGRVLLCLTDPRDGGLLGGWLRRIGAVGVIVSADRLDADLAARTAPTFDAAVIDLDVMGDPGQSMDLCLILRQAAPALPVVVIQSETGRADPLALKLGLCHAELPRGFSEDDAALALSLAARQAGRPRRG